MSVTRFGGMVVLMMRFFDEFCFVFLDRLAAFHLQQHMEFVRFGKFGGGFEEFRSGLKLKNLAFPGMPSRFNRHVSGRRRWGGVAVSVKKIKPKSRWHAGFEDAQLDPSADNFNQRTPMRTMRLLREMIMV